jgi:hypothetical protein
MLLTGPRIERKTNTLGNGMGGGESPFPQRNRMIHAVIKDDVDPGRLEVAGFHRLIGAERPVGSAIQL